MNIFWIFKNQAFNQTQIFLRILIHKAFSLFLLFILFQYIFMSSWKYLSEVKVLFYQL